MNITLSYLSGGSRHTDYTISGLYNTSKPYKPIKDLRPVEGQAAWGQAMEVPDNRTLTAAERGSV